MHGYSIVYKLYDSFPRASVVGILVEFVPLTIISDKTTQLELRIDCSVVENNSLIKIW